MPTIQSKLPGVGLTIFTQMTNLANQYQAINLSQGFPDFEPSEKLLSLVKKYYAVGYNQYAPMAGVLALREQIAQKQEALYGVAVDAATEITITSGGTQALFSAISTLIRPGDEVIIFEPAYDSYRPAIELYGGKVVAIPLVAPDFQIDWHFVRSQVTSATRMVLINNPTNPTGRVWSAADLADLADLATAADLFVLSDEVYEHMVYSGHVHQSIWSIPELHDRSFVVASFGKLLHTTGWKMGYILASEPLMREFQKVHQYTVFSANTPVQYAIADFIADAHEYLQLGSFFEGKRNLLQAGLAGSKFRLLPCEGTYFQLLDYSMVSDASEMDFARQLIVDHKIATVPVSAFYCNSLNQNLLRVCFAKKDETILQAIDNLLSI